MIEAIKVTTSRNQTFVKNLKLTSHGTSWPFYSSFLPTIFFISSSIDRWGEHIGHGTLHRTEYWNPRGVVGLVVGYVAQGIVGLMVGYSSLVVGLVVGYSSLCGSVGGRVFLIMW